MEDWLQGSLLFTHFKFISAIQILFFAFLQPFAQSDQSKIVYVKASVLLRFSNSVMLLLHQTIEYQTFLDWLAARSEWIDQLFTTQLRS